MCSIWIKRTRRADSSINQGRSIYSNSLEKVQKLTKSQELARTSTNLVSGFSIVIFIGILFRVFKLLILLA